MSLPTWAKLSIIGAIVVLSPALAFLTAIAVEIVIGVLVDAGGLALPALIAAGAVGGLLQRKVWRRPGGTAVET